MTNVKEQWDAWRSTDTLPNDFKAQFINWVNQLTAENNDADDAFANWRLIPQDKRDSMLSSVIDGHIVATGTYCQFELGLFFGLFCVLCKKRCFVASPFHADVNAVRDILKKISELQNIKLKAAGSVFQAPNVYLADCKDADLIFADFFQLMTALNRHRDEFQNIVQSLFILEADIALYNNRVMLFERGAARGAGAIYKTTGKLSAEWQLANNAMDVPRELSKLNGLLCAGSISKTDKYTASELSILTKGYIKAVDKPDKPIPFSAFTFRKNTERCSAIVNDVIKAPGNALVICFSDSLLKDLQEEFRKSGQECTITTRSYDIPTFFSLANPADNKKVLLVRGVPSTLLIHRTISQGALFIAEHFHCPNIHEKIMLIAQQLFDFTQPPRVYFSLDDPLFSFYESEAGFTKLFDFIDFTEKYDPWRQIRRVLAKSMIHKLHAIRVKSLDEDTPIFTTALATQKVMSVPKESQRVASKMDAPCFCGSGKPFRECHGKKMA